MASTFTLHCADQSLSTLLNLPTEIRLIILRDLLARANQVHPLFSCCHIRGITSQIISNYHENASCSSQLLRTCQQLYAEGYNILYEENTLCITTRSRIAETMVDRLSYPLLALNGLIEIPRSHIWLDAGASLLSCAQYQVDYPAAPTLLDATDEAHTHKQKFLQNYEVMTRFTHYEVLLKIIRQEDINIACRLMRKLLHRKHVSILFDVPSHADSQRWIGGCKTLRCASISLRVLQGDMIPEEDDAETKRVITSTEPIRNTYSMYQQIETIRDLKLIRWGDVQVQSSYRRVMRRMENVAMGYDYAGFLVEKEKLLNLVDQWLVHSHPDNIAEAQSIASHVGRRVAQICTEDQN